MVGNYVGVAYAGVKAVAYDPKGEINFGDLAKRAHKNAIAASGNYSGWGVSIRKIKLKKSFFGKTKVIPMSDWHKVRVGSEAGDGWYTSYKGAFKAGFDLRDRIQKQNRGW